MKIRLTRHYDNIFQLGIGKTSPKSPNLYIHLGFWLLWIVRD